MMMAGTLPFVLIAATAPALLMNGDFSDGLGNWRPSERDLLTEAVSIDGRLAAHIRVPSGAQIGWPSLYQPFDAEPDAILICKLEAMARNVAGGFGVYAAIEFQNADGGRVGVAQSGPALRDGKWTHLAVRAIVPRNTAQARVSLILNGHGDAYFSDVRLADGGMAAIEPLEGPITLTVTDQVVCKSLSGFGVEDDGWFYAPCNTHNGVDDEAVAIREARIEWMDPDWVRMFFWYKDWNPSEDWETFTFDNPNMASHYRTLDLYQRLGAVVNVVGVEWEKEDPYGAPEKMAKAAGALLEHLTRTRGYTCVRQWTLTNEPNGYFASRYSFDAYVRLHELVKREIDLRDLDIEIVGSDECDDDVGWFTRCVERKSHFDRCGLFVSHRYIDPCDRLLLPSFLEDRLKSLAGKDPVKPFVIGEFGFRDKDLSDPMMNSLMQSYPYAVWTSALAIDGLNRGVAGFSIWCLQEAYYPANMGLMNYGLWDFKRNDWNVRPVYHAWASFCRLTERGDQVRKCESDQPQHVLGAVVNETLFWVNQSQQNTEIQVKGKPLTSAQVMSEDTLAGDRVTGETVPVVEGWFEAPPMSFGYAR
jgi:hypothetical protein